MEQQRLSLIWAAMLHDAGKLCCRAGLWEGHALSGEALLRQTGAPPAALEAVRYHHAASLREAGLPADSPAYLLWAANRIAAGGGEDPEDGDPEPPLLSIFDRLNGEPQGMACPAGGTERLTYPAPAADCRRSPGWYRELWDRLVPGLAALPPGADSTAPLLELCETLFSDLPASTGREAAGDISLYDHSRMTAALACCIQDYCREKGVTDYRAFLFEGEASFRQEDAFLLCSCDFSGIQRFLYQVDSDGALRSLRARSFFLELLMEHQTDELLERCGLSRASLLYSGGGHCYLLLPNTGEARRQLAEWSRLLRRWLIRHFGAALYLGFGWLGCSANDLLNHPAEASPYSGLFRRLSEELGRGKLRRYSPEELALLNAMEAGARECRICGSAAADGEEDLCPWCAAFPRLAARLMDPDCAAVVTEKRPAAPFLALPGPAEGQDLYLSLCTQGEARAMGADCRRVYRKGPSREPFPRSVRIHLGDYAYSSLLEELTEEDGISRTGVLRMDVDGLGQAFIGGFRRKEAEDPAEGERYVTLTRYMAFSRQMSLFFKHHINEILRGEGKDPARVVVVYSGGDDVLLAGGWSDVIRSAQGIHRAFLRYTLCRLTISGGIALCPVRYPLYLSAQEAGALEEDAKELEGKNAVSLFQPGTNRYRWDVFEQRVAGEKLALLQRYFAEQTDLGSTLLYQLLEHLREDSQRISIARYAYLLARLEPRSRDPEGQALYREFSRQMYQWILNPEDRRQLITAVYLMIYQRRSSKGGAASGI